MVIFCHMTVWHKWLRHVITRFVKKLLESSIVTEMELIDDSTNHADSEYIACVTNFIWPYLHQSFNNSHGLNSYEKLLKRPFNQYQSHLKEISISQDIRQIN